jgi:hypothetical protein
VGPEIREPPSPEDKVVMMSRDWREEQSPQQNRTAFNPRVMRSDDLTDKIEAEIGDCLNLESIKELGEVVSAFNTDRRGLKSWKATQAARREMILSMEDEPQIRILCEALARNSIQVEGKLICRGLTENETPSTLCQERKRQVRKSVKTLG